MSLSINTNLVSLTAQRHLGIAANLTGQAMERLSSGQRINSAGDDAAGLAISNRLTSQVRGLNQAIRNANDGISMLQVAEGALGETTAILQRMRELSIQSASGIYSDSDRATLNAEYTQLKAEIDRIAANTRFNDLNLLDGSASGVSLQVGAVDNQTIDFKLLSTQASELGLSNSPTGFIGDEIGLSASTGLLSGDLSNRIAINGTSLTGVNEGSSLQDLLHAINTQIDGVEASSVIQARATLQGNGILSGADTLQINVADLYGGLQTYILSNTDSLQGLADAITENTGGRLRAAVNDNGYLEIVSDSVASMLFSDSTGGIASGFETSGALDEGIANIVTSLTSYWLGQSQDLISAQLGLEFTAPDNLTLNLFTDAPSGNLASISWTQVDGNGEATNLTLNIDLADYGDITTPDGIADIGYSLERVILHEMVHAAMAVNIDLTGKQGDGLSVTDEPPLPGWFTEGIAELMHGADDTLVRYYQAGFIDSSTELNTLFIEAKDHGSPSAAAYSAGYLATKMLHDDMVANSSGIDELIDILEVNSDLDAAIQTLNSEGKTDFADLATFETYFETNGFAYLTGTLTAINGNAGSSRLNVNLAGTADNEAATDTGSIFGSDYGGAARTASGSNSVLDNDNTATSNPLTSALNFIVPDDYSGDFYSTTARLVLESDAPLSVASTSFGSDNDLARLGLSALESDSQFTGAALDADDQNAALVAGELVINGISVDAVIANEGLMAKVDAINAVSDETGVAASVTAYGSFRLTEDLGTEYFSQAGLPLAADAVVGINGIGIQLLDGDDASAVAGRINTLSNYHGATAYADDSGRLHIFSDSVLNLAGAAFASLNFAAAVAQSGSLKLNGQEISLSDISNSSTIVDEINQSSGMSGVTASIDNQGQLVLEGTSAVQIALGATNGLKTLDALGISFGLSGDENLTDTDADNNFGDEVYTLKSRIHLRSIYDERFTVSTTAAARSSTGLSDLNAFEISGLGGVLAQQGIATQSSAQRSISVIDNALEQINNTLSDIGAAINRLDFTVNNLSSISLNSASARSRIMDADFAAESSMLSRAQILQRASAAMLAQANAQPAQVLNLLR